MIETIIQSTSYSDLLAITLAENVKVLGADTITVYTARGDKDTLKVCAGLNVKCIETDNFTKNGSAFCRGAVYNEAFANLVHKDWVLILDSDIVLPADFLTNLARHGLHKEYFYGARRFNLERWKDWVSVKGGLRPLTDFTLFRGFGYGYLQLFNAKSFIFQSLLPNAYPEHSDGSEADWRFRNNFGDIVWKPDFNLKGHLEDKVEDHGTHYLRCLPFHVIHLGITGVNATGRATPLFTA